ncbi:hypothetical protein N7541_003002 [Penicillium brevicompactum]|uniref:Uncharacterized protein n=1 Tax=Penicillium brevicompactum TaxID=5074 RepID=A0A9W9RQX9_PENBR|nr:hypothetical protein N7541_003002 [Penicillium brevicompactum]
MTLVFDNIRKPLGVFAKQAESQCYIKSIRNLGDAWRKLSDKTLPECDKNAIFVETTFGLDIKFTLDEVEISVARVTESEEAEQESPVPNIVTKLQSPDVDRVPTATATRPRRYRISYDWGTENLWREYDDLEPEDDGVTHMEVEDLLGSGSFPPSVMERYFAWSDTYNDTFKTRLADTGDYDRSLFATTPEHVAWLVAGYFLAWRIAMAPEVDCIEFSTGTKKWLLQKGKGLETKFTKEFFEIISDFLENGPDC